MHKTKLAARVAAKNRANQLAMDAQAQLFAVFSPFIGKKIFINGGNFVATLRAATSETLKSFRTDTSEINFYGSGQYSLCAIARASEVFEGRRFYAETIFYIGDVDRGIDLKSLYVTSVFRTDFNEMEIAENRLKVQSARTALQDLEYKICEFGESDNC